MVIFAIWRNVLNLGSSFATPNDEETRWEVLMTEFVETKHKRTEVKTAESVSSTAISQ